MIVEGDVTDVSRPNADARDERERRNNGASSHEEVPREAAMKD